MSTPPLPLLLLFALSLGGCAAPATTRAPHAADAGHIATFSIVAFDPQTKELGVAVQSKFIAVGAVVPWARAGVGAVATQALANVSYGPKGLDLLAAGKTPDAACDALMSADPGRDSRQLGMVDAQGRSATRTGASCYPWAGGKRGKHYACQGNLLAGQAVVDAMARQFERTSGPLGERMLAALAAGQSAGGDKRGRQSAALLIVRKGWGYGGSDTYRDLRVDDHKTPIVELTRIYQLHKRVFPHRAR